MSLRSSGAVLCALLATGGACGDDDDDDSAAALPSDAPEVSNLRVLAQPAGIGDGCQFVVKADIHDEQADLAGGLAHIEFQGGGGGDASFTSDFEEASYEVDTAFSAAINVPDQLANDMNFDNMDFWVEDGAGNVGDVVSYGPVSTPDADCALP